MTSALVLSALVGIVMPLGDTAVASAQAATLDQAMPESSAVEPGPNEAMVEETTPEEQATETPATPAPSTEAPDSDEAAPEAPAPDKLSAAPRAQAAPFATPSGPWFAWTVTDAEGQPLSGAQVTLQGPAKQQGRNDVTWPTSYTVTDCVGTCGASSMDQDPRPGAFVVDRLVSGNRVTVLPQATRNERYRVQPVQPPAGQAWASSDWAEIPGQTGRNLTYRPAPNPWSKQSFDFGDLRLQPAALECVSGSVYSLKEDGQLQQVTAKFSTKPTATIKTIVSSAGISGSHFNGLAIGAGGEEVFAFNRKASPHEVYRLDTTRLSWTKQERQTIDIDQNGALEGLQLIAGAVDPSGTYWVGGFVKGEVSSREGNFQLWAMSSTTGKMELRGQLNVRGAEKNTSSNGNGDIAFDNQGNLYLVRGKNNSSALAVFRANATDLAGKKDQQLVSVETVIGANGANSPFNGVAGVAYDASGRLFLGGGGGIGFLDAPLGNSAAKRIPTDNSWASTDLASCGYPPTIKLQKNLPDGRVAPGDQFRLKLDAGGDSSWETETSGSEVGPQRQTLGPIPVMAGGTISISETVVGNTGPGNYASRWECKVGDEVLAEGTGRNNVEPIEIPLATQGKEVLCTFTNTIAQAKKSAVPESGTAVHRDDAQGGIVRYTLSFDNSTGPTATDVLYSDYLADVLDDAEFVDDTGKPSNVPVVKATGGIVYSQAQHWNADKKILRVQGKVPAKSKASLSFSVRVFENSKNAEAREDASNAQSSPQGYFLRNKLARGTSETPPAECKPGLCTEHPINAWTVTKDSLPADGARLHKGGNVHYKVTATKANAQTSLNGLVLSDDLTHVFKSAGWDPGAVVPGGANRAGVYLFNKDNRTVGLDGKPNSESPAYLRSVQDVPAPTERNFAAPGAPDDMRWIVTSGAPINLPKEAERAEMWFAVVAAESPVGIPEASIWEGQGAAPVSGWQFVNYATGIATKRPESQMGDFAPNECATGMNVPDTSAVPNAAEPVDLKFPEQCRVQHSVSQNFFTIRKDAAGAGVQALADDSAWDPDPTGLWNMVGHEFEIRDNDPKTTAPTSYPSVKLCRTDYSPAENWNGKWISAANAGDENRWAFGSEGAAIQQGILDWNNAHPEAKPLPVCGTIYEISSGAQKGRWRSENLESGDYWLIETKAPNAQAAVNATTKNPRPVPGVQRLAQPVPFKVWPEADGLALGGSSMQGRGQLDVGNGSGGYLDRCNPGEQDENGEFVQGGTVAERRTACVHSTGYLMLVKDPAPTPLPLTGGIGPWMLWGGGAAVLLIATAGIIWWRVRRPVAPRHGA